MNLSSRPLEETGQECCGQGSPGLVVQHLVQSNGCAAEERAAAHRRQVLVDGAATDPRRHHWPAGSGEIHGSHQGPGGVLASKGISGHCND